MGNFFTELKRRHIYRVAAAYAVVAWVLLQLFNNLTPVMRLPDWAGTFVLVLLVGGFAVAVVFAWIHELNTPDSATAKRASTGVLDWALMGALVVVLASISYQQLAPPRALVTQQLGVEAARAEAAKPAGISLAVLPFVNLSSDKEQEFFSDGMTEEITAALAKVPDLRVVARTSAFEFKGKNVNIKTMGEQLGATHLIEGSVRKAGDKLRITAQLIRADDGTHLWAEDYDRQFTDIFQIQEDIARAIATSLRMPLGLKPGQNLVSSRNIPPEVYQEFLRIRARQQANTNKRLEAIADLEKQLSRTPSFAKAWAFLSQTYLRDKLQELYANTVEPPKDARQQLLPIYDKAEKAAREAVRLDETEVLAYPALAEVAIYRNDWVAAEDLVRKGLSFDPYDPDILLAQADFLVKTGRMKQALQVMQQLHDLEPLAPSSNYWLAWGYVANNQPDAAIALLSAGRKAGTLVGMRFIVASAYAMKEQFDKAADMVLAEVGGRQGLIFGQTILEDAARLLKNAPQKATDPKALPPLHEYMNFAYAYVGAEDRLLDFAERSLEVGLFGQVRYLFNPVYSPARKTERFKTLISKAGLVHYWKAHGWPDMCHAATATDFECE